MTTGTSPDVRPAARRWAAGLLGLPENVTPEEAKRAYYRKLRECDFLASRPLRHALRVLVGKPAPAEFDEERLLEEEGRLRADVESFAAEFFTLPVTQRRKCWDVLRSRCQSVSPLTARLQALKAGLEIEIQSLPLDQALRGQLASHLLQTFPLPPLAQATSRQVFLRQIEGASAAVHRKGWEKAARYLLAEWPALAALDKELVQHIATLRHRLKRRHKMSQRSRRRYPLAAGSEKRNPWWLLLIGLGMLSGVLSGLTTSNNSSSSRPPSPSYSTPRDGMKLPGLVNVPQPIITDPMTGAKSPELVPSNLPPVHELFDPSKFDVEIINPKDYLFLRFTPRPNSTITGPNGPKANNGQPLMFGEAGLKLMGVSQEQINSLKSRAAEGKRPADTPKTPPAGVGQRPPKSSQGDKTRP